MRSIGTYLLATRPQFLPGIIIPVGVGAAAAWRAAGAFDLPLFLLTIAAAVLYHGGMNALNDYFDSINGTDEINTGALTPFTGGSRFIQTGLLTRAETFGLGASLVAAGSAIGLWLAIETTPLLLVIGAAGLFSGFFYSAPPIFLAGRGLGELTVGLNFGLFAVTGSYVVQTSTIAAEAVFASLPVAFLITALLYVNEFPDYEADRASGKRTLVVRLGPRRARYGLAAIVAGAYLSVAAGLLLGHLPLSALITFASLPVAAAGVRGLVRDYAGGARLLPAIKSIILAHLLTGLLLAAALVLSPR